jgi:hypothetical protein
VEDIQERIRQRAYELSQSDDAGSDEENWHRAEREVRGDEPDPGGPWAKTSSGDADTIAE